MHKVALPPGRPKSLNIFTIKLRQMDGGEVWPLVSRKLKIKHNHAQNLEIVLRELRQGKTLGGTSLEQLADKCNVSTRQIYRYFNELQNMGFKILKTVNPVTSRHGYIIKEPDNLEQGADLYLLDMIGNLEQLKNQIQSAILFVKELLLRTWLLQNGIVLPLTCPIISYNLNDAVTIHKQRLVISDSLEEPLEELKLKVIPKAAGMVARSLAAEIVARQRNLDGDYIFNIRTKRLKEVGGLIMQWGGQVEVLEPGWLRHKIIENCKLIIHEYHKKKMSKSSIYSTNDKLPISQ